MEFCVLWDSGVFFLGILDGLAWLTLIWPFSFFFLGFGFLVVHGPRWALLSVSFLLSLWWIGTRLLFLFLLCFFLCWRSSWDRVWIRSSLGLSMDSPQICWERVGFAFGLEYIVLLVEWCLDSLSSGLSSWDPSGLSWIRLRAWVWFSLNGLGWVEIEGY